MRDALHRTTGLLLALLFVGGLAGQAYGLRPCPHHLRDAGEHAGHAGDGAARDGTPAQFAHEPGVGHRHGGDEAQPPTAASGAQAAPSAGATSLEAPAPAHGGPCTCVGSCLAGPASVLLPGTTVVPQPTPAGPTIATPAAADGGRTISAYLLPFANGPPSPLP